MNTNRVLTFIAFFALILVPSVTATQAAGVTVGPETEVDGLGGLTVEAGDSTTLGVQHENGLGGSVYFVRTGHSLQVHWTEGITHCWLDIPTDGTTGDPGPHCVY